MAAIRIIIVPRIPKQTPEQMGRECKAAYAEASKRAAWRAKKG